MSGEEYSVRGGWSATGCIGAELAAALVKAQGMIEGAKKGKENDYFKSKYADLASVWDACRDALQANGLAVVQLPCQAPAGYVGLVTAVVHSSGQSLSEKFFMPLKDPTNPQAAGSALTYARRYALAAAIGVCPEDDDGNAAAAPLRPAVAQVKASATGESVDRYVSDYLAGSAINSESAMKLAYSNLKNSSVKESLKRSLLGSWAKDIKNLQLSKSS